MINEKRIVPVTNTDLLTLYGLILKVGGTTISTVSAGDTGVFSMTSGSGNKLADEPVKSFDFGSSVTSAVIYFVAAYDYEGFSVAGTAVTTSGTEVAPDGTTLYTATLSSGAVTIAKVGL